MTVHGTAKGRPVGARFNTLNLGHVFNWPRRALKDEWWRDLAAAARSYPEGRQTSWGIPFLMGAGPSRRVILVSKTHPQVTIALSGKADFLCVLHEWPQLPCDVMPAGKAREGRPVGRYEFVYSDGTTHVHPVRARYDVTMLESPGPTWLVTFEVITTSSRRPAIARPRTSSDTPRW